MLNRTRGNSNRTVSNATLARCHLSVRILLFNYILDGGCTCEKNIVLSLKRHLFPHGDRVKMLAQGSPDLFCDAAPPISNTFSISSGSALKRHLLKRRLTPAVPKITRIGSLPSENPADPCRDPAEPLKRARGGPCGKFPSESLTASDGDPPEL